MCGTGFEPEEDSLRSSSRVRLRQLRLLLLAGLLAAAMRGTGFEPADSYETAS